MSATRFLSLGCRVLAVVLVLYLLLVLIAWIFQRHLIYLPDGSSPEPPPGGRVEELHYTTSDGKAMTAWFVPARGSGADGSGAEDREPRATIVVSSGNAGNRAGRLELAEGLARHGYAVLLTDYRGYGGNPGSPRESHLADDLGAAVDAVARRPEVDTERLVYFGESLGSGVASQLAARRPPAALVLRSPFTSLTDVAQGHYRFLPVRLLLSDRYPTRTHLAEYPGPVLVVAGGSDSVVPVDLSRRLAEDHGAGPLTYHEVPGADHNDHALAAGPELLDAVVPFLAEALPPEG